MNAPRYIARINWRQLLIHFLASWFFIHSFITLSYLANTRLVDIYRGTNEATDMKALFNSGITASDLSDFTIWTTGSGFIGLLVAFVISLIISIRRGWYWMNSLIVLMGTYLLQWVSSLGWTYVRKVFWFIGATIHNTNWEFTVNGIILLAIGVFIFFFHKTNEFIENGNSSIQL
jgi:hypothetical protein